ncbi:MAG: SDR family NAD(P)-dependent oxidoreductase [Acidimicrobiales bacterium]
MTEPLVLITGASGYLGRLLARRYAEAGSAVLLAVRGAGRERLEDDLGGCGGRLRFVEVDLEREDPFASVDSECRRSITRIVNAAAVTRFNVERELARRVNVEGTRRALELARTCPALESFGQLSTVYATGLRAGVIAETDYDDTAGFANAYEWSKWEAERLVLAAGDVPWRLLRVATVVAGDDSGSVTQYNAFHETLKLWFYGLLSLIPGRGETPLYFVTGSFAADAVVELMAPGAAGGIYHVAHDRSEALTLDQVLDVVFEQFASVEDFAKKRILRPLLADEETFELLVSGVTSFGGSLVTQALANVMPFARQLYVAKELDNTRLRAALSDYRAPDPALLLATTCGQLVASRWGRRLADA